VSPGRFCKGRREKKREGEIFDEFGQNSFEFLKSSKFDPKVVVNGSEVILNG
jgi:hypothetical protein